MIESNFLVEIVLRIRIRIDSGFLDPDPYLDTDPRIRVTKIYSKKPWENQTKTNQNIRKSLIFFNRTLDKQFVYAQNYRRQ